MSTPLTQYLPTSLDGFQWIEHSLLRPEVSVRNVVGSGVRLVRRFGVSRNSETSTSDIEVEASTSNTRGPHILT